MTQSTENRQEKAIVPQNNKTIAYERNGRTKSRLRLNLKLRSNMIETIAKIIRIIGIIILIVSIVWGAFLAHYIFGMIVFRSFRYYSWNTRC